MSEVCSKCGQLIASNAYDWNYNKSTLSFSGVVAKLQRSHAGIFEILHTSIGYVFSREAIHMQLYGNCINDMPELKIIDVFLCRLRKAIKDSPFLIVNYFGRGFALEFKSEAMV